MYGNWSGLKNDEVACMGDNIVSHYKRKQIRMKTTIATNIATDNNNHKGQVKPELKVISGNLIH